ncbi:MAG TPA: ABC transporter permease [Polyangiaceae bacterium]|nr:ABC transporter permease [Polyangiaceae bacterium]
MTLASLAIRNLARDKLRVALTAAGVATAILTFLLLRAVVWAWTAGPRLAARDRVVTRNKVTFAMSLPKHYVDQVRKAPHVVAATWASWFGGRDPRHDTSFFSTLAVDPATFFTVYDDMETTPAAREAFARDRRGAIVGDLLARRLGWTVGDRVTLRSGIVPGEWEFTIDGTYTAASRAVDRASFVLRWDYVNDAIPPEYRDRIGWIVSRVDDSARTAEIGAQIDRIFDERDTQTLSQDERSISASFLAMFSAVLEAVDAVCATIIGVMTLVMANTIAMGVRERTNEYGVLLAIGFRPAHLALSVAAEGFVIGLAGATVGAGLAWPFVNLLVRRVVDDTFGSLIPNLRLEPRHVAQALAAALIAAPVAAALPAWRASRLRVVAALRRVG